MGPRGWANANLRTTFGKIVRRAGLQPWPRLFQNLRASRETELMEVFPIHVVTEWLGNTQSVAMKHYLMTTDEHFDQAAGFQPKAAQNAAQQMRAKTAWDRKRIQKSTKKPRFCRVVRAIAKLC